MVFFCGKDIMVTLSYSFFLTKESCAKRVTSIRDVDIADNDIGAVCRLDRLANLNTIGVYSCSYVCVMPAMCGNAGMLGNEQ
jgi:hypothetical protein